MTDAQALDVRLIASKTYKDTGLGHGTDHLLRVEAMALRFLPEGGDRNIASAVAMLHDADDYKLVPKDIDPDLLPNATDILNTAGVLKDDQEYVKACIRTIGYSKRLAGVMPTAPEAMAVSDADMCEILGADGLMRLAEWRHGRLSDVFRPDALPNPDKSLEEYRSARGNTIVEHLFEKVLKLPGLMLTEAGRMEAYVRWQFDVAFLQELFRERGEDRWSAYLKRYLEKYPV